MGAKIGDNAISLSLSETLDMSHCDIQCAEQSLISAAVGQLLAYLGGGFFLRKKMRYLHDPVLGRPPPLPLEHGVDAGGLRHGDGLLVGEVPLASVLVQFVMVQTFERRLSAQNHLVAALLRTESSDDDNTNSISAVVQSGSAAAAAAAGGGEDMSKQVSWTEEGEMRCSLMPTPLFSIFGNEYLKEI